MINLVLATISRPCINIGSHRHTMAQQTLSIGAVNIMWDGATPPSPTVLQCVGAPGSQEALDALHGLIPAAVHQVHLRGLLSR